MDEVKAFESAQLNGQNCHRFEAKKVPNKLIDPERLTLE